MRRLKKRYGRGFDRDDPSHPLSSADFFSPSLCPPFCAIRCAQCAYGGGASQKKEGSRRTGFFAIVHGVAFFRSAIFPYLVDFELLENRDRCVFVCVRVYDRFSYSIFFCCVRSRTARFDLAALWPVKEGVVSKAFVAQR